MLYNEIRKALEFKSNIQNNLGVESFIDALPRNLRTAINSTIHERVFDSHSFL